MTDPLLSRRSVLTRGLGASLGLLFARGRARARPDDGLPRACIVVWLSGGPSHLDTFDPKPGTRTGGPTRALATRVRGLSLADPFEGLAERARHLAVLRSLSTREGDHERGSYLLHTGFAPSATVQHPTLGSLLSAELEADPRLPAFVCLGPERIGPGYRGAAHAAYRVDGGSSLLEGSGLSAARRRRRRELLASLEVPFARRTGLQEEGGEAPRLAAHARAAAILQGPLREALDLSREDQATRARYGPGGGQRLLTARRLVDVGVRCVEVELPGWDDHQDIFTRLPARCRELDRALSALLDDLLARERLDSTLVLCLGEFGRTPDINERGGRDHHPAAFSALLAGGGVPGGRVVGSTCPEGRRVTSEPAGVPDLFATVTRLLGLDPRAQRYAGERPLTLVDGGRPIPALLPG